MLHTKRKPLKLKFYNTSSNDIFLDVVNQNFLECYTHGMEPYNVFGNERLVIKSTGYNKKNFINLGNYIKPNNNLDKNAITTREIAQTQNNIDVTRSQDFNMLDITECGYSY